MRGSAEYTIVSLLGGLLVIGLTGFMLRIVYFRLRWGIVELFVTLVGGTIPLFFLTRDSSVRNNILDVGQMASLALVFAGGILLTTIGSGLAMRWIEGMQLQRSFWRVPLLMLGWFLIPFGCVQIAALIAVPFIFFDHNRDVIPFCAYSAASMVIWLVVAMLNRKVRLKDCSGLDLRRESRDFRSN